MECLCAYLSEASSDDRIDCPATISVRVDSRRCAVTIRCGDGRAAITMDASGASASVDLFANRFEEHPQSFLWSVSGQNLIIYRRH